MRFPLFCAASAILAAKIIACSSSSTDNTKVPNEGGPGGAIGSGGKATSSGGTASSGGNTSGTGGGADPALCAIDSGADECRLCLMGHCCDDFKSCEADAACATTFGTYQNCVKGAKGDGNVVSACFSTFAGSVSSTRSAFTSCDVLSCSVECGGPLSL